jgi:DNA (cytosine-5)-methyltransferase 1
MKMLNLYACLGGNRYKWDEVADIQVTAVELDPEAARLYRERFTNDEVIIADAHEYLLNHFKEFDFIWSSPPCPTHSRVRMSQVNTAGFKPTFPSMILYEEIIFLEHNFKGGWLVENVIPYYEPLIQASKRGRHLYWSNFHLPTDLGARKQTGNMIEKGNIEQLSTFHEFDFRQYKGEQRLDKMARNLVDYAVGKTILEAYLGKELTNVAQQSFF